MLVDKSAARLDLLTAVSSVFPMVANLATAMVALLEGS
jgi:hypothetical protein